MKLEQLLLFEHIVIQCHDNPDADAIASGYGILAWLQEQGKSPRLIYGGKQPIRKKNLVLMVNCLDIPIEHVQELSEEPDLLLLVDCQYGERNVQPFAGKTVAEIDHHKSKASAPSEWKEHRDNYGACATIVWDMMCRAGFYEEERRAGRSSELEERLATAFYYGLYMDTGRMQELRHPRDKDLRDTMEFRRSQSLLFLFQNNNLTLEELTIAGKALSSYDHCAEHRFAIVRADRCDPNILGVISDLLIEVEAVDTCAAYCMLEDGAKLSVRSCVRETRANELAEYLCGGGGHPHKAGGFLKESLAAQEYEEAYRQPIPDPAEQGIHRLLTDRMRRYFEEQDLIYSGTGRVPDLSDAPLYRKLPVTIGYVRGADLYPAGTKVIVRMLEGDLPVTVELDTYFIIGIESEVYINTEAYFLSHNVPGEAPYEFHGEYAPTVREAVKAVGVESRSLKEYARTCVPKGDSLIHAREITRRTKVFVDWSDSYMLGNPGDLLASRADNPADVYIIRKDIFEKTYERCTEEETLRHTEK